MRGRGVWTLGIFLSGSGIASAADLDVRAAVSRTQVRVGDTVELSLSVTREGRGGGDVPEPEMPAGVEDAFEVANCMPGVRRSIDMFRGEQQHTRTLECVLIAEKPGEYSLGFAVADADRRVQSNVVEVRVVGDAAPAVSSATQEDAPSPEVFERLRQQGIAVVSGVDKTTAFVGEQITYRLDLYEARNFLDPHFRSPPTFKDFLTQELPVDEPKVESRGGMRFRIRPGIRRALFAQRAGSLEIGGAEVAIGLRGRQRSEPISIEVKPLPAEGQPTGFSPNNVGQYSLRASIDRTSVPVGEPFTYTVVLEGEGNIEVVDPGDWTLPEGVRRYDPKIETKLRGTTEVGGERTYRFLMIPERAGTLEIAAPHFDYFNPARERYEVARAEPITLEVLGDAPELDAAKGTTPSAGAPDAVGDAAFAPIIAVDRVPRRRPEAPWLTARRWFYGMLAVPLFALAGWIGGVAWRRLGPDDRARAKALATRRRRILEEQAQQTLESGEGFHGAIASLLQEVALERAGAEGVGLPRPRLLDLLERRGMSEDDCRALERLLDACDAARFGAARGTASERRALLDEALRLARGMKVGGGR